MQYLVHRLSVMLMARPRVSKEAPPFLPPQVTLSGAFAVFSAFLCSLGHLPAGITWICLFK